LLFLPTFTRSLFLPFSIVIFIPFSLLSRLYSETFAFWGVFTPQMTVLSLVNTCFRWVSTQTLLPLTQQPWPQYHAQSCLAMLSFGTYLGLLYNLFVLFPEAGTSPTDSWRLIITRNTNPVGRIYVLGHDWPLVNGATCGTSPSYV
jgi:hypothetical protein